MMCSIAQRTMQQELRTEKLSEDSFGGFCPLDYADDLQALDGQVHAGTLHGLPFGGSPERRLRAALGSERR